MKIILFLGTLVALGLAKLDDESKINSSDNLPKLPNLDLAGGLPQLPAGMMNLAGALPQLPAGMKLDDLKDAFQNMPPAMKDRLNSMAESFGLKMDDVEEALNNPPPQLQAYFENNDQAQNNGGNFEVPIQVGPGQMPDLASMMGGMDISSLMKNVNLDSLLGNTDVNALLQNIDIGSIMKNVDVGSLLQGGADIGSIMQNMDIGSIMKNIDVESVIKNLDFGPLMQGGGLASIMNNMDIGSIMKNVDVDSIMKNMDIGSLMQGGSLGSIMKNMDIGSLMQGGGLGSILRNVDIGSLMQGGGLGSILRNMDIGSIMENLDLTSLMQNVDFKDVGKMVGVPIPNMKNIMKKFGLPAICSLLPLVMNIFMPRHHEPVPEPMRPMVPPMMMQPPLMPLDLEVNVNIEQSENDMPSLPAYMPKYLLGTEQALDSDIESLKSDRHVYHHIMMVRQALRQGEMPEEALQELIEDLMEARLKKRMLMVKNMFLRDRLATMQEDMQEMYEPDNISQIPDRPLRASPIMRALTGRM